MGRKGNIDKKKSRVSVAFPGSLSKQPQGWWGGCVRLDRCQEPHLVLKLGVSGPYAQTIFCSISRLIDRKLNSTLRRQNLSTTRMWGTNVAWSDTPECQPPKFFLYYTVMFHTFNTVIGSRKPSPPAGSQRQPHLFRYPAGFMQDSSTASIPSDAL